MLQVKKVYKTEESILIVTATTDGCAGRNYVSVTADEIQPMLKTDAIDRVREGFEGGELWRMAVQSEQTELGLEDWIDEVLSNDPLDGFDNSLYTDILTIEGKEYIFDSRSCGCLHAAISEATPEFNRLIELHLSDKPHDLKEAETLILAMQKDENTDIDFMVEKYTREILEIEA